VEEVRSRAGIGSSPQWLGPVASAHSSSPGRGAAAARLRIS
jgi:hypothetical protein